jgi:hypothetical protein
MEEDLLSFSQRNGFPVGLPRTNRGISVWLTETVRAAWDMPILHHSKVSETHRFKEVV